MATCQAFATPYGSRVTCGIVWGVGRKPSAFSALARRLADLPASSLAWLISTLLLAGAPSDHPLVEQAAVHLELLQEPNGRWSSEDGPTRDVHTTLEALRALTLCRHG